MNETILLSIFAYLLALHMFQIFVMGKKTTALPSGTSTAFTNITDSQHSSSACPGIYESYKIFCTQSGPLLKCSYCATYNENSKILSHVKCPYFQPKCLKHHDC